MLFIHSSFLLWSFHFHYFTQKWFRFFCIRLLIYLCAVFTNLFVGFSFVKLECLVLFALFGHVSVFFKSYNTTRRNKLKGIGKRIPFNLFLLVVLYDLLFIHLRFFLLEFEWQQVFSGFQNSSLGDLNHAVVWMVSPCPFISMFCSLFTNHLGIVPSAPPTTGITVTFMFQSFFSNSLAKSWCLSLLLPSFIFLFLKSFLFSLSFIIILIPASFSHQV